MKTCIFIPVQYNPAGAGWSCNPFQNFTSLCDETFFFFTIKNFCIQLQALQILRFVSIIECYQLATKITDLTL